MTTLQIPQLLVMAIECQQFIVVATFDNFSGIENNDFIGMAE